jgi:prepilin-type N-terminal cleavage/methylation domain-containing protein
LRNFIERRRASEKGFTLIELLVVIVILGILAAVVVFAVGGLTDKGETSSCKIDTRTIKTAEEAYFAGSATATPPLGDGTYTDMPGLVAAKLLESPSTYHTLTGTETVTTPAHTGPPWSAYTVKTTNNSTGAKCGGKDAVVNGTSVY